MSPFALRFRAAALSGLLALGPCAVDAAHAQNAPDAAAAAKRQRTERAAAAASSSASAVRRSAKPAPAKAVAARPPAPVAGAFDPEALARCKHEAGINLIKRERCVYARCKGHWGEGECPPGRDMPSKDSFKNPFRKGDAPAPPATR